MWQEETWLWSVVHTPGGSYVVWSLAVTLFTWVPCYFIKAPLLDITWVSFWCWWTRESNHLTWPGKKANVAPDSPVLTGSPGPSDHCQHQTFLPAAPEHPCPEQPHGKQNSDLATTSPPACIHITASVFSVKCQSRCCCEGILQVWFRSTIKWL